MRGIVNDARVGAFSLGAYVGVFPRTCMPQFEVLIF